jgi:hypothetical protein
MGVALLTRRRQYALVDVARPGPASMTECPRTGRFPESHEALRHHGKARNDLQFHLHSKLATMVRPYFLKYTNEIVTDKEEKLSFPNREFGRIR